MDLSGNSLDVNGDFLGDSGGSSNVSNSSSLDFNQNSFDSFDGLCFLGSDDSLQLDSDSSNSDVDFANDNSGNSDSGNHCSEYNLRFDNGDFSWGLLDNSNDLSDNLSNSSGVLLGFVKGSSDDLESLLGGSNLLMNFRDFSLDDDLVNDSQFQVDLFNHFVSFNNLFNVFGGSLHGDFNSQFDSKFFHLDCGMVDLLDNSSVMDSEVFPLSSQDYDLSSDNNSLCDTDSSKSQGE